MDPTPNQQQPQQAPYVQPQQVPQPQQAPYQQAPYQQAPAPQQQAAYQRPRTPQMPTQPISATVSPNGAGSNRRAYAIIGVVIAALVVFVVALAMTFGGQATSSRSTGRNGESATTTRDRGTSTRDRNKDKDDEDDGAAPKKRNTSPYGTNGGDSSRQHQDASLTLGDFLE